MKEKLWELLRNVSFRDFCDVPYSEILNRPRYIFLNEELNRIEKGLEKILEL